MYKRQILQSGVTTCVLWSTKLLITNWYTWCYCDIEQNTLQADCDGKHHTSVVLRCYDFAHGLRRNLSHMKHCMYENRKYILAHDSESDALRVACGCTRETYSHQRADDDTLSSCDTAHEA